LLNVLLQLANKNGINKQKQKTKTKICFLEIINGLCEILGIKLNHFLLVEHTFQHSWILLALRIVQSVQQWAMGLDGLGSILGSARLFSSIQHSDQLQALPNNHCNPFLKQHQLIGLCNGDIICDL
jgi:hypothetical protein